jgi:hypothetical protein
LQGHHQRIAISTRTSGQDAVIVTAAKYNGLQRWYYAIALHV